MKPERSIGLIAVFLALVVLGAGCGQKEGHEEHEESSSGASFKEGKGITLTDETRQILEVKIADVTEEKLPQVIRFNVQIFSETHRFIDPEEYHSGCDIHGSGSLSPDNMAIVEPKQPVKLVTSSKETLDGFVVAVKKALGHGEGEVIVGITTSAAKVKDGEFMAASITIPREEMVTVIPRSAILKTAEGTFAYVLNSSAYYRTAVKTASESDDKVGIIDGLFAGDQVVTDPVETLWLIELRATKGGGHSH